MEKSGRFSDVVTTTNELREIVGDVYPAAVTKVIDHLDEFCIDFIRHAPFFVIGSGGGPRDVDVSPKGDPGGIVKGIDQATLAILARFEEYPPHDVAQSLNSGAKNHPVARNRDVAVRADDHPASTFDMLAADLEQALDGRRALLIG